MLVIGLILFCRLFQWRGDNEGFQDIFDFDNNSDLSDDCMKEFEVELDLDEDDVLL